jgi:8-oxo-dGTP pyrophosphatase MutT (NUDIX family)
MASCPDALRQAAAIPVKDGRVCLVTSRSGKRWVVPKGCLELGKTAGEIALQEAWEEAGLLGRLLPGPIGSYVYDKAGITCYVLLFHMHVVEEAQDWPEQGQRQRRWFSPAQALARVEEASLREVMRSLLPAEVA